MSPEPSPPSTPAEPRRRPFVNFGGSLVYQAFTERDPFVNGPPTHSGCRAAPIVAPPSETRVSVAPAQESPPQTPPTAGLVPAVNAAVIVGALLTAPLSVADRIVLLIVARVTICWLEPLKWLRLRGQCAAMTAGAV